MGCCARLAIRHDVRPVIAMQVLAGNLIASCSYGQTLFGLHLRPGRRWDTCAWNSRIWQLVSHSLILRIHSSKDI